MFCIRCGKQIPDGAKFCPYCGYNLSGSLSYNQPQENASLNHNNDIHTVQGLQGADTNEASNFSSDAEGEEKNEIQEDIDNITSFSLGKKLEELVSTIFLSKGYVVKNRVKLKGKGNVENEIDLIVIKKDSSTAIECKNYDRPVGKEAVMYFSKKLEDSVGAPENALFVTNSDYTSDAIAFGQSVGIEMWNGEKLKEEYFNTVIGRGVHNNKSLENALPVNLKPEFVEKVGLVNAANVSVDRIRLTYHPYYVIEYIVNVLKTLPTRTPVTIDDRGKVLVDAFYGHAVPRDDKWVAYYNETNITPVDKYDTTVFNDIVNILPASLDSGSAEMMARTYISKINTKIVYSKLQNGQDKQYSVGPTTKEIIVKNNGLLYIPYYEVGFVSRKKSYTRLVLASSGKVLWDDVSICPYHGGDYYNTVYRAMAVCEVCGQALCEKHIIHAPDGKYYCERDLPEQFREKKQSAFSKAKGLFSK